MAGSDMHQKGYYRGPPSPYMGEAAAKPKARLNSGNYINVVPMPVGVQYHRRKYSPHILPDYQ